MRVIIHHIRTTDGEYKLQTKVSEIHAQAIAGCLRNLNWTKRQKYDLIDKIKSELK